MARRASPSRAATLRRRLRGRTTAELLDRGRQALSAAAERWGLSADVKPPSERSLDHVLRADAFPAAPGDASAGSLLDGFRRRGGVGFFASFADRDATMAAWRRQFGDGVAGEVLAAAENVRQGRFDLLGHAALRFGDPIDWHLDPISGRRAPDRHWSRIDYLDPAVAGDKKVTWELNRHQHLQLLGRAYWLSGDETWADLFVRHVESWMAANPPKVGINWASSLEVAFRAIAWVWALHFFSGSDRVTEDFFRRVVYYLHVHGRHLETYPSRYFSPNTHLTGEALGLYYLGCAFPELARAARWREMGQEILLGQLPRHVRPDGVYFEQATYYHLYTIDIYTHFLLLSRAQARSLPAALDDRLQALLDHAMHMMLPEGRIPLIGDDDGGRISLLDTRPPDDPRPALATGGLLFERADYRFVAERPGEATLWLLGPAALDAWADPPPAMPARESVAFPAGGYYVMRNGWGPEADQMILDGGPHGVLGGGHAHDDALSLLLSVKGRTILTDPGTYTYTGNAEDRDRFRSAAMHNAMTVDGSGPSVPAGPFSWLRAVDACVEQWNATERCDYFAARHDGFVALDPGLRCRREVLALRGDYWIVRDRLEGGGSHEVELHFHLAPDASASLDEGGEPRVSPCHGQCGLAISARGGERCWEHRSGWVSPRYGCRVPAGWLVYRTGSRGGADIVTFLLPISPHGGQRVVALPAVRIEGGWAYRLQRADGGKDILLLRTAERVADADVSSDFRWTWLRYEADERLREVVAIGGRTIRRADLTLLALDDHADWAWGRHGRDAMRFAIKSGKERTDLP